MSDLAEMIYGYGACVRWIGVFDDDGCSVEVAGLDFEPSAWDEIVSDVTDFYADNRDDLAEYVANVGGWAQAGHDLYLTRCGHGAGFWDRGAGEAGDRLTTAARVYGSVLYYVNADMQICQN